MSRVFISYKRDVDPDQALAARLLSDLRQRGHEVFIDRTMKPGQVWAKEIESQVKGSDFFIPLITAASSNSEMVKGEIEMARGQAEDNGGRPYILPVRLNFIGALPYPLNAWLAPIQYAFWKDDADSDRLVEELAAAIAGTPLPSIAPAVLTPATTADPPSYSAQLPPPGGALQADDPWYIPRSMDALATGLMSQGGITIVIKGPRQMGKTSLLVRTLKVASEIGKRCIWIDFQMLGAECLTNSTTFFQSFAHLLVEALDLPHDVETHWNPSIPTPLNLTRFMEKQILQVLNQPVVLAIDEADVLFQAPFLFDFFGMIRSWHNNRANPMKQIWRKLDLILVTSTEPYLFIDRLNQSPFNVGEVLTLCDFNFDQFSALNASHRSPLLEEETSRLYELLGGQPFLTRRAFYVLSNGTKPDTLFAQAADGRGPFGDHLRYYLLCLASRPELATALKQVTQGNGCADESIAYRLESAGLVKFEAGKAVPRCDLYKRYFRDHL